jgi:hypothetical protein
VKGFFFWDGSGLSSAHQNLFTSVYSIASLQRAGMELHFSSDERIGDTA